MKKIFWIIGISFFIQTVNAVTIEEAMKNYNDKNFSEAHKNFIELATLGNTRAQFNIGVMYARGEHVDVDLAESHAWFSLVQENNGEQDAEKVIGILEAKMTEERRKSAAQRLTELRTNYGNEAVENGYFPVSKTDTGENFVSAKSIVKAKANYPKKMLKNGLSGIVDIEFLIEKDGSVRYPTVLGSTNKAFAKAAVEAVLTNRYEPASLNGNPVYEYGRRMRVIFEIQGAEINQARVKRIIDPLKEDALNGGGNAKYVYAYTLTMLGSLGKGMKGYELLDLESANTWFSKSAQDGFSAAKYELGRRLAYGQYCNVDDKKALFWLEQAAKQNLADAQLMLGLEYLSGSRTEQNLVEGMALITKAAEDGHEHAKLRYAWIVATSGHIDKKALTTAEVYLNTVKPRKYPDKLSYYETVAALASAKGDFSAATSAVKKGKKVQDELGIESLRLERINDAIDKRSHYVESI